MALTNDQKTSFVFKKAVAQVSDTLVSREFFEEPYSGRDIVLPSQVWNEAGSIPNTAPSSLGDGGTSGVVTRYIDRNMSAVTGAPNAFYLAELVDSIPFNFGDGSYNYTIKTSTNSTIAFGSGDWVVNNASGTLLFYGTLPSGVSATFPPKISFYRYTGTKGVGGGTIGASADVNTSGIITATAFYGDGSNLTGISGGGGGGAAGLWEQTFVGINTISNVGIGTTNPTQKLEVFGNIVASGTVTANSDEKLKTNIKTIENALDKVLSIRGVEYDRIDNNDRQIGVIAQEIEKVIPDIVYPKGTTPSYGVKSVAYGNIVALLIEAIKEQNLRIDELERRLEEI